MAAEDRIFDKLEPPFLCQETSFSLLAKEGPVLHSNELPWGVWRLQCSCSWCIQAAPSEGPCPGGGTGQTQTGGRDEGCPSLGRHHCGSSRLGKAGVGRRAVHSFLWTRKKQLSAQTHSTELSALMAGLAGNLGGKLTDCQSPRCTFSLHFCFQSRNCLRT